ncbi:MAG: hypothetical protein JST33_08605 [Actinobacteria bacterium]|nr:hypothetical protein [Actinomycetota bacterium]
MLSNESDSPVRAVRSIYSLLLTVAAVLCIPVLIMTFSQYVDAHENVASQCVYAQPPGVALTEAPIVYAAETAVPAGRLCVYEASGGGVISTQTGWPTTILGLLATVAAAAVTFLALRYRRSHGVILTLLPVIVIAGLWTIVALSAHAVH